MHFYMSNGKAVYELSLTPVDSNNAIQILSCTHIHTLWTPTLIALSRSYFEEGSITLNEFNYKYFLLIYPIF